MSSIPFMIQRYAWTIDYLLRHPYAEQGDIEEAWKKSSLARNNKEIFNRKTWYNCYDEIAINFGILIDVDRTGGRGYRYIRNPEDIEGKDIENWLISVARNKNMLFDFLDMHDRIDVEGFPSENDMLKPIVKAMRNRKKLTVTYRRYQCETSKTYTVDPIFIKSYKRRLYVLCRSYGNLFFHIAFDRILKLDILEKKFKFPDGFNIQDYYKYSYGVMRVDGEEPPEPIVIRAWGDCPKYLMDTPLHPSQEVLESTDEYTDFKLCLYPTRDFIGDILQQAGRIKVISPKSLSDEIKEIVKRMYEIFS